MGARRQRDLEAGKIIGMATTVSLLVIRAFNMEAALAFYCALGLTFSEEQHVSGPVHYACEVGDLIFEIYPARVGDATDATMIGFAVEALDETLAALQTLGFEPKSPPKTASWGRFVNVADGDGRTVQLTEK